MHENYVFPIIIQNLLWRKFPVVAHQFIVSSPIKIALRYLVTNILLTVHYISFQVTCTDTTELNYVYVKCSTGLVQFAANFRANIGLTEVQPL